MSLRVRLALVVLLTSVPLAAGLNWLVMDLERQAIEEELRDMIVTRMESGERDRCEESPETYGGAGFGRDPRHRSRRPGRDRPRGGRSRRPPPRGSLEVWAYDVNYQSANPDAPELPSSMQEALRTGKNEVAIWQTIAPRPRSDSRARSEPRPETEPRPDSEPRGRPEGLIPADTPMTRRLDLALRMEWDEGPCAVVLVSRRRPAEATGPLGLHWSSLVVAGVALLAVLLAAGPPVRRIRKLTDDVRRSVDDRYASAVEVRGRDEIADLAAAFNDAGAEIRSQLEQLEQREQALRSFLGNTTHDVMVPLTVLQGHLSSLRRGIEASQPADPDVLIAALDETQYISSLLHNLGAVAKLEGTDTVVRSDPVHLGDLVERAVARHRPLAEAHKIEINCAVPEDAVEIVGDMTLLEQAVSNVVHNAVRYNDTGGHIAVVLECADGRFKLRIVDDGPGIPPEELARLPERRFRGEEARTRHPEGNGLGLHIARDVAARHGIDLELRASEYGGLEVEFSGSVIASDATTA